MTVTEHRDLDYPYLLYKIGEKNNPNINLMFLHGKGEQGQDLTSVKEVGLPNYVDILERKCQLHQAHITMMVPQFTNMEKVGPYKLVGLIDRLFETPCISSIMASLSLGGILAGKCCKIPATQRFDKYAIVCGWLPDKPEVDYKNAQIGWWHGAKDNVVSIDRNYSREKELFENTTLSIFRVIYENAKHNIWNLVYGDEYSVFYDFLFATNIVTPENTEVEETPSGGSYEDCLNDLQAFIDQKRQAI